MTSPEPTARPAYDVLGAPEPARRSGGDRARNAAAALVGAGAIAVAGSAVAFAAFLGGGGAQPEDVLPADALGLVKLDLDPSAEQKVAVYRLAERFPSTSDRVESQDSVKDELLSALFEDQEDLDYDKDVKPWIGDRVGVALMPGGEEPQPLFAVAFDDRSGAEAAMEDLREDDDEVFYAFSEKADYVLIGTSQKAVDEAAAPERVLADAAAWKDGMDALDGDQILTVWADLGAVSSSLPDEARQEAAEAYGLEAGEFELAGTLVMGVHAADDHVELVGKALDLESPVVLESAVGGGKGSDLVRGLPEDTIGALSVTNLGSGLAELFETAYGDDDPLGVVASAEEFGLELPDDLRTLLGEETVVGVFGEEEVAVRARTKDVDAAFRTASTLAEALMGSADPSVLRRLEDGIAAGTSPEALDAIATADGGLGDSPAFRTAVPDAEDAGYLLYVDIARALELAGGDLGEGAEDAKQLQAVGISGSGDQRSSTFRLRLTVKG